MLCVFLKFSLWPLLLLWIYACVQNVLVLLDWMSNEAVKTVNSNQPPSLYISEAMQARRVTPEQEQRLKKAFRYWCDHRTSWLRHHRLYSITSCTNRRYMVSISSYMMQLARLHYCPTKLFGCSRHMLQALRQLSYRITIMFAKRSNFNTWWETPKIISTFVGDMAGPHEHMLLTLINNEAGLCVDHLVSISMLVHWHSSLFLYCFLLLPLSYWFAVCGTMMEMANWIRKSLWKCSGIL